MALLLSVLLALGASFQPGPAMALAPVVAARSAGVSGAVRVDLLWAAGPADVSGMPPAGSFRVDLLRAASPADVPGMRVAQEARGADQVPLGWPAPGGAFGWPVDAPQVVRAFDPPAQPWLAGHRGVDLAVPVSSVVYAAGAGTVVYAGRLAGRGVVSVAHPGGLRTTYEPVTSDLRVGDPVAAGQLVGTLEAGHPGCPAPACLHWGLRRGERYLDPLALLGLGRVRLLPLSGGSG